MTYIIGEIGQNHNGSVAMAKAIIDLISIEIEEEVFGIKCRGINAVKLTKRDLRQELTKAELARPYNTVHSFGTTYGKHREALELSDNDHLEIYKYAKDHGLEFVETLCARGCLSLLRLFSPDALKVASRDLTNIPLLSALAETKIPMIISTGMTGEAELGAAVDVISRYHDDLSILHCVSEYPTHPKHVNLKTIQWLKENYSQYRIGYSDHTIGISAPIAAVALGAEVIEKHVTLDRRLKGTDQAGSLGPDGVRRMVRDIRLIEQSLGVKEMRCEESVSASKQKLERSIATTRDLRKGHVIQESDLHLLSPGNGFRWSELGEVVGKVLKFNVSADCLILPTDIE